LLAIGDHTIRVTVDEMAVDSPRSISLSMDGMKPARERARGLLHEIIDDEKHRPMILSYDGRILGHGTLKLRHRIAELMNWVAVFVWFVGWVGLTCAIYAVSPLGMALGIWGWLPCVLLGLLLALSFAPHVFARPEVESSESTFS
jgi:hypothetical protein